MTGEYIGCQKLIRDVQASFYHCSANCTNLVAEHTSGPGAGQASFTLDESQCKKESLADHYLHTIKPLCPRGGCVVYHLACSSELRCSIRDVNYRPITLSPVISKIFEKCILQKFSNCFESEPLQFGFKKIPVPHSLCLFYYKW